MITRPGKPAIGHPFRVFDGFHVQDYSEFHVFWLNCVQITFTLRSNCVQITFKLRKTYEKSSRTTLPAQTFQERVS